MHESIIKCIKCVSTRIGGNRVLEPILLLKTNKLLLLSLFPPSH